MGELALDKEKETLLILLFGKAKESGKDNPILIDLLALEIVENRRPAPKSIGA